MTTEYVPAGMYPNACPRPSVVRGLVISVSPVLSEYKVIRGDGGSVVVFAG